MISGVAQSFASVTILKVLSRILQFFLRVYLIRQILTPEILAQMIALDLLLTTSLHIAKSCFKPSYQQVQTKQQNQTIISSMNLMSIGILATAFSALVVAFLQWHHKIQLPYTNQSILIYGLCAILQSFKEKYSVQFTIKYQYRTLALIELFSYLPKTLMLFLAAKAGLFEKFGILVFAGGQLLFYAICLTVTVYLTNYKIITVKTLDDKGTYFDTKTKKILKQLSLLSILKLLLQQFEKIVLVINNSIEHSSIFSLVSNLGSIIVRFVFLTLQQISYNYYTRGSQEESRNTFIELVRIILVFSMLCVGFGVRYSENVLFVLYGQKWVNFDSVFALQCYMVLLGVIGINGMVQTFVMARADAVLTIPKLKYFTIVNALVFIGSSLFLLHIGLGAAGLFIGNTIGMMTRIIINWNIQIKKHLTLRNFIKRVFPCKMFIILLVLSLIISYGIKQHVMKFNHFVDLVIGIILCGLTILPVLYSYKLQISTFLRKSRAKDSKKQQ